MEPQKKSRRFLFSVLTVFVVLSVTDLVLTWLLLTAEQGETIESNPIAAWTLENLGWGGMAGFKLAMVSLIAGIAYVVTCRRPRAAELLLVFGCGAQAAIVTTSVFMYYSKEPCEAVPIWACGGEVRDTPTLPTDAATLLVRKPVQAELKLSQTQSAAIAEIAKLRRGLAQISRRVSISEGTLRLEQIQSCERDFMGSLSPEQANRLQQLVWQQRGPLAFGDPEVVEALKLEGEQFDKILVTIDRVNSMETPRRNRRVNSEATAGDDEDPIAQAKSELLSLLTFEQESKWKDMMGQPFALETRGTVRAVADAE
jgi:hypothetical protein